MDIGRIILLGLVIGAIPFGIKYTLRKMHERSVLKIAGSASDSALSVCQEREFEINADYDKSFDMCINSVAEIQNGRIINQDKDGGNIEVKVRTTWKTAPSSIGFKLTKIDTSTTKINIISKPAFYIESAKQYDFGQNYKNIEIICGCLNRISTLSKL